MKEWRAKQDSNIPNISKIELNPTIRYWVQWRQLLVNDEK